MISFSFVYYYTRSSFAILILDRHMMKCETVVGFCSVALLSPIALSSTMFLSSSSKANDDELRCDRRHNKKYTNAEYRHGMISTSNGTWSSRWSECADSSRWTSCQTVVVSESYRRCIAVTVAAVLADGGRPIHFAAKRAFVVAFLAHEVTRAVEDHLLISLISHGRKCNDTSISFTVAVIVGAGGGSKDNEESDEDGEEYSIGSDDGLHRWMS